tara:strand:+ start:147 stop:305 length:159 start_codon:yes stop_codon:yes gene_type:complete
MEIPNCPKCTSALRETEFLITEDDTKPGLECINPHCSFVVCELLGEFLYDDC